MKTLAAIPSVASQAAGRADVLPEVSSALTAIRQIVGQKGWLDEIADLEPYILEERGLFRGTCHAVVRPGNTTEAAAVVRICAEAGVPIVPQGGNTGLCGGGVPDGGIVLSTTRMTKIRAVDAADRTMTVEAGAILADVQRSAADAGLLFPLSLGAEGSCRIGGNLATNAGGINVVRYGNARDLVLGLEVVLPDGRIWDGLKQLRKDNTGYDLRSLFLGSEGTLGIITAAVLKLFPIPCSTVTSLIAVEDPTAAIDLLNRLQNVCGDALSAFEYFSQVAFDLCRRNVSGIHDPFDASHPAYVLVSLTSPRANDPLQTALEAVLEAAFDDGVVLDAVVASSVQQAQDIWRIREGIPEAQKAEGGSIKNDVSVPVSRVPDFMRRATAAVEKVLPGIRVVAFGHLGDGNIHFNLSQPVGMDQQAYLGQWEYFTRIVADEAVALGGSFSAEHGIGRLKCGDMEHYKSEVELDLMRALKTAIDPQGIMNPGKILR